MSMVMFLVGKQLCFVDYSVAIFLYERKAAQMLLSTIGGDGIDFRRLNGCTVPRLLPTPLMVIRPAFDCDNITNPPM